MNSHQREIAEKAYKPFQPLMGACASIALKGKRFRWLSSVPITAVGFVATRWIRWKVYGRFV